MQFVDLELVRRLEAAEAQAARECAQFLARKKPESGAVTIDIMGGMAAFTGIGSPVTQAIALGLHGAVTEAEMNELEDFYRTRNCGGEHRSLPARRSHALRAAIQSAAIR